MKKIMCAVFLLMISFFANAKWVALFDVRDVQWSIEDTSFKILKVDDSVYFRILLKSFNKSTNTVSEELAFVIAPGTCAQGTGAFLVLDAGLSKILHSGEVNITGENASDKITALMCTAASELARKNNYHMPGKFL